MSNLPTKPAKLTDPGEKERILMVYAGIFPDDIKGYAEAMNTFHIKPKKNYSR